MIRRLQEGYWPDNDRNIRTQRRRCIYRVYYWINIKNGNIRRNVNSEICGDKWFYHTSQSLQNDRNVSTISWIVIHEACSFWLNFYTNSFFFVFSPRGKKRKKDELVQSKKKNRPMMTYVRKRNKNKKKGNPRYRKRWYSRRISQSNTGESGQTYLSRFVSTSRRLAFTMTNY